jgi:hypothetical protein
MAGEKRTPAGLIEFLRWRERERLAAATGQDVRVPKPGQSCPRGANEIGPHPRLKLAP